MKNVNSVDSFSTYVEAVEDILVKRPSQGWINRFLKLPFQIIYAGFGHWTRPLLWFCFAYLASVFFVARFLPDLAPEPLPIEAITQGIYVVWFYMGLWLIVIWAFFSAPSVMYKSLITQKQFDDCMDVAREQGDEINSKVFLTQVETLEEVTKQRSIRWLAFGGALWTIAILSLRKIISHDELESPPAIALEIFPLIAPILFIVATAISYRQYCIKLIALLKLVHAQTIDNAPTNSISE